MRTRVAKRGAVLELIDRGCGISEEDGEDIFQPFVSRKMGGSGLGLSIAKKVVEAHGGQISFHSNSGKGVTFVVKLPFQGPGERVDEIADTVNR